LYYEEERQKSELRRSLTLIQNTDVPNLDQRGENGRTHEILAKKVGIGKSSMANLLAVYRNRHDLFERLTFCGKVRLVGEGFYAYIRKTGVMKDGKYLTNLTCNFTFYAPIG
jgi:hypothetical protein